MCRLSLFIMSESDLSKLLKHFEEKRREDNDRNEKRFRELSALIGKALDKNSPNLNEPRSGAESDPDDDVSVRSLGSSQNEAGKPPKKKRRVISPDSDVDNGLDMTALIDKESVCPDSESVDRKQKDDDDALIIHEDPEEIV